MQKSYEHNWLDISKYSSTYTYNQDNYAIITKGRGKSDNQFIESPLYGVFCVVQNILQRGEPSKPSEFLKAAIGVADKDRSIHLISALPANWGSTIKGDDLSSDYPAILFFDEILPQYLGEYSFIRNLILPEAEFDEVIGSVTGFGGQQVDFYIPLLNLVIEIDGYHHDQSGQIDKDRSRDQLLLKNNIDVLRIRTYDIKNRTGRLRAQMEELLLRAKDNDTLKEYKDSINQFNYNSGAISDSELELEAVGRLQLMILQCLKNQLLDIESKKWKIFISYSDVERIEELLKVAYADLHDWIGAVAGLLKMNITLPEIMFSSTSEDADLNIDFSVFQRYDDSCWVDDGKVCVRTDYYYGRSYYHVAVSETLHYKVDLGTESQDVKHLEFLLENIFGFSQGFRPGQLPIIANVLNGRDTVGILPTGSGKSLCYQVAALLQPGITIVIVPIISLMLDQKRSMTEKGIDHNDMLNLMQSGSAKANVQKCFEEGCLQMLWISPERFQAPDFRNNLAMINRRLHFSHVVIDEVHCLSEWGHDFRISYLTLVHSVREYCPAAILLGLTATASEFVLKDIRAEFGYHGMLDYADIKSLPSMDRPNLHFKRIKVNNEEERKNEILNLLDRKLNKRDPEPGLLFCPTFKRNDTGCVGMSKLLEEEWHGSYRLFAGQMNQQDKINNQKDFMNNAFPLMVCTKAFGMGVDKQNLRFTIHNSLPASVESFYQEAGRAGRDMKDATCYIIYNVNENTRKVINALNSQDNLLRILEKGAQKILKDSDFGTTVYFFRSNHVDENEEFKFIYHVVVKLSNESILPFGGGGGIADKGRLEKALYKLTILGFVYSWTVEYDNLYSGRIIVQKPDFDDLTVEAVKENFLSYVGRYDTEFSLEKSFDGLYLSMLRRQGNRYENLIRMLIHWTNQNILYQRIQCSKTMMDWCDEAIDDETFRNNLEGYFRFTEETLLFEYIAFNPREWEKWFDVLYELNDEKTKRMKVVSREKGQKIYAGLRRFLESYRNNTGFDYLDGLLQLMTKQEPDREDLIRMENSLQTIQSYSLKDQMEILRETVEFGRLLDKIEKKDLLSRVLLDYYPDEAQAIFRHMHDRYSLSKELEKRKTRLEGIQWTI